MARKFVVDEADLKEMLVALMEYSMLQRDGVDNWSWYGESFHETVQDFYPEQLSIDEIRENDIGFQECADAMLEGGKYQELIETPSALIDDLLQKLTAAEAIAAAN